MTVTQEIPQPDAELLPVAGSNTCRAPRLPPVRTPEEARHDLAAQHKAGRRAEQPARCLEAIKVSKRRRLGHGFKQVHGGCGPGVAGYAVRGLMMHQSACKPPMFAGQRQSRFL